MDESNENTMVNIHSAHKKALKKSLNLVQQE